MDAGPFYLQERSPIYPGETAGELGSRLSESGAALFVRTLDGIEDGSLEAKPQDDTLATMAPKLVKTDGRIDWTRPAVEIINLVHGVNPWPGAYTTIAGETLKVWRAEFAGGTRNDGAEPGTVLVASPKLGLVVAAGEGMVLLTEVQAQGTRRMRGRDYLAGHALAEGARFV
jgi:methionyl-tRNA formyltransferase